MSMFTLAISCLSTSSLPWFMNLTFQVPMQYCTLQHRTLLLSPVTSTTGVVFALAPSLCSFWSYFSTDLQHHIGHLLTWEVHLSVYYLFAFSYCSLGSQGKNTKVVWHSLLQWTIFCQTSPQWPSHLGWPHKPWLIFIELDKTVFHVIRLANSLWLQFQSVCPLIPSLSAYRLTWVSLTLVLGVSLRGCSSKAQPLLLTSDVA